MKRISQYAVALASATAAIALRWILDPWLGDNLPLVTLFGAIAFAVWFGGYGPAIVSALFGWVACAYLFIQHRYDVSYPTWGSAIGFIAYLVTSGLIIGFGEALYRQRRQARAGLEFLRVAFNSIGDAVITTDADENVTFLNPVAEELTGWTRREATGKPLAVVFNIVDESTRAPVESPASKVLRLSTIVGLANHTVLIDRAGRERAIDDSAAPIRDADGQTQGVILVFRDNTVRRAAEKLVRQSEQDLGDFFDNAAVGLHWVGPTGTILRANRAELEMLGYTQHEYVGHDIAEFHVDQALINDVLNRLVAGETIVDREAQMRCKDGSIRDVSISSNALRDADGSFLHSRCFTTDITAQRRAEIAGRRLAAIVESSEDAIVSKDLNGIVTSWNDAAKRMFGYSADEMIGQSITRLIPPGHDNEEPEILDRIRRGMRIQNYESVRRRKDGTLIPVSLSVSPILDLQGKVVGASKIARDITYLKEAEHELREADRRKDAFLATLAHELRNPLAPIRNAIHVLKSEGALDPLTASMSRDVIDRQARVMTRLLDDLLDVSRVTRNRMDLQWQQVPLASILDSALETSRPIVESSKHAVDISMPADPVFLEADPVRLAQVFSNLLNNAAKFTSPGGSIRIDAARNGDQVVVSVKDNGMGISPEMMPHVFELFSHAPSASGVQTGLGIGLALAQGIVRMHGGEIAARSDGAGKGAELIVTLPMTRRAVVETADMVNGSRSTASRRVLIVDDHRDNADSLAVLLRVSGHEVQQAYDGEAALDVAARFKPDIVLLDLGMPNMDGFETCRRMRKQPWGRAVVIVAVTGLGQHEDRRRTEEAGFDRHMVKPLEPDALELLLSQ